MEGQKVYLADRFVFTTRELADAAVALMGTASGASVREAVVDEYKDDAVRGLRIYHAHFSGDPLRIEVKSYGFGHLAEPNAPGPATISEEGESVYVSAKNAEEAALAAIEARSRFLASK